MFAASTLMCHLEGCVKVELLRRPRVLAVTLHRCTSSVNSHCHHLKGSYASLSLNKERHQLLPFLFLKNTAFFSINQVRLLGNALVQNSRSDRESKNLGCRVRLEEMRLIDKALHTLDAAMC